MKNFILATTALALCTVSFAQVPDLSKFQHRFSQPHNTELPQSKKDAIAKAGHSPDTTLTCFQFTSGNNNTFLSYRVAPNGNIISLETPEGHPQVSSDKFEGYGICDANSLVAYYDFGGFGDSGNWGPATIVSRTATSIKIARTTSDGIWTLTQTINQVSGNTPNVKVTMAIQNNTNGPREAVLMRYADVDADADSVDELDATFGTAMAYNSAFTGDGGAPFGLSLLNEGNTPFTFDAYTQNTFFPPDPCTPFANAAGPLESTDGSIVQLYFMPLNAFRSGTVILSYRGL